MRQLSLKQLSMIAVLVACSAASGWLANTLYFKSSSHHKRVNRLIKKTDYKLTSPLLDFELPEGNDQFNEALPFKYKVNAFVKQREDGVSIQKISIYYRDLLDGPWIGINETQEFNPASMMKVPVMIAWLKRAELNPNELKRTFVFDGKNNLSELQSIKPAQTIAQGKPYTVEELLKFMLRYSDNNATSLLYFNLKAEEINDVLNNMDVNNVPNEESNSVSVTGYSGFFRILYNATYLNRKMSEKALELLSHEEFPQGFAAGVPKGTVIASKFGEFGGSKLGESKQLHEFGIIYTPKGAFILGVMTRGNDYVRQAEVLKDVAALFYNEMNSVKFNTDRR